MEIIRLYKRQGQDIRGVLPKGSGCTMAHPDLCKSVDPISTRGTDYAHLITTDTPEFSDLPTALNVQKNQDSRIQTLLESSTSRSLWHLLNDFDQNSKFLNDFDQNSKFNRFI